MVCLSNQLIEASNLIPTMVKEYSLDSSLYNEKEQDKEQYEDAPKNSNYILQSFSLDQYKTKNDNNPKLNKNKIKNKNMNENWLTLVTDYLYSYSYPYPDTKTELDLDLDIDFASETILLNRVIINASNGLLNMCDKLIEKTTSVLPMSYSYKLATDMETFEPVISINIEDVVDITTVVTQTIGNVVTEKIRESDSFGILSYFLPKPSETSLAIKKAAKEQQETKELSLPEVLLKIEASKELQRANMKKQIVDDMTDYQQHRATINKRELFLNSLCSYSFGSPYTLYYNSTNNTLNFALNIDALRHYMVVVQNVIDNSHIRGFNRVFKLQKDEKGVKEKDIKEKGKGKDKDNTYNGLNYDIDLDIDKAKTKSLVEKATYILPILQKIEYQLPTYLADISKWSLTGKEYFDNLKQFWDNIEKQTTIGAHESPFKYKAQLLEKERTFELQRLKEFEMNKKVEQDALRVIQEFKNKQLVEEAENYVREQQIFQKDRKVNFNIMEWDQFNRNIKHYVSGFTGVFVSGVSGVLKSPVNFLMDFTSETIMELGKVAIMLLVLVSLCLSIFNKITSFVFTIGSKRE
jgi:hypothetical protein